MIVVDSSAILAILFAELDTATFRAAIVAEKRCVMSAVNAHETIVVLHHRRGKIGVETFWQLVEDLRIEIVAFDETQVHAAADAFDRFGKGIHSKARLNLCDCVAYALARTMSCPLLFKGDDFSHTDIAAAV